METCISKGKPVKLTMKERLPLQIEEMFETVDETVIIYKTNYSDGVIRFKHSPDGRKALQRFLKMRTDYGKKKSSN